MAPVDARWDAKISRIESKAAAAQAEAQARHQRHHDKLARFAAEQRESFNALFADSRS